MHATTATSAEAVSSPTDYRWIIAPYLWLPDIDGEIGMGPLSVPLDLGAMDLAGNLDAGFMGYLRYGNDRQFIYGEGIGMRFRDREFEPFFNQSVDARVILGELGYGRHYALEYSNGGEMLFSPYIGLRHTRIDVKVSNPASRLKADELWLDLALGVIVEGPLYGSLSWALKLDGAGFNLDKGSYFSLVGGIQYPASDRITLVAVYRWAEFRAEPGGGQLARSSRSPGGYDGGAQLPFRYGAGTACGQVGENGGRTGPFAGRHQAVTPQQRQEALEYRRNSYLKMYSEIR